MALENGKPSWVGMPRKWQLTILALCRISDFSQFAAFQAWCYYQLESLQIVPNQSILAWQTSLAISAYTASQGITAILLGPVRGTNLGSDIN